MGNHQQTFSQKLSTKYDFISYQKDSTLGPIKIYRKRQPFYNYLMVVDRFIDQPDLQKHTQQLNAIDTKQKSQTESMLLKVYGKEVVEDSVNNGCGRKVQLRLYVEYLNYSLKSLCEHRNKNYAKFTIDEVIYVVNCVLEIYRFFTSIDATECSFQTQDIYLTPEGEVRFSPLQIFSKPSIDQTDCIQANCMPVRFKKTFRIQDKLILYEIKKLVSEMTELCDPRVFDDKNLFGLKKKISSCDSLKDIEDFVWKSQVERLEFNPKKPLVSQEDTTKGLSVSNSSKISVKYVKR